MIFSAKIAPGPHFSASGPLILGPHLPILIYLQGLQKNFLSKPSVALHAKSESNIKKYTSLAKICKICKNSNIFKKCQEVLKCTFWYLVLA